MSQATQKTRPDEGCMCDLCCGFGLQREGRDED
jgi:hypothetical protein